MTADVIVLGGGVIGLSTAIVLAERGSRVRVWSPREAADTTSAVAGGLWWPYRIEPEAQVGDWSLRSLRLYERLADDPGDTGVRMVPGVHAGVRLADHGPWTAQVPGLREVYGDEVPGHHEVGLRAVTPLIDMPVHLGRLRRRLEAAGGTVLSRAAGSLAEAAAEAPTVVNCTGLAARELAADPEVHPVRGQLVVVEDPGVEEWFTSVDEAAATTYLLPQPGRLLLGGTAQENDGDPLPDPATAEAIVARCARIHPAAAEAKVIGHRVGLRPARTSGVRIDAERLPGGGLVVHNYGHGGAGITVAWGCADAAAALVP
ncbi:FAD-binding oxidoreductase [Streptomyces triticagri]|uniref:D-amino-acid oxidase n=1 Tax=Streptomyces triticagri TaxID=2293568 RepID=A0A372M986_9ACTN|nr:FAD-dependent oxidoreductase [Streptomyces triticagri]RFU87190.1 FAD-binding oxidoreductase [Streptomyces triticagri]